MVDTDTIIDNIVKIRWWDRDRKIHFPMPAFYLDQTNQQSDILTLNQTAVMGINRVLWISDQTSWLGGGQSPLVFRARGSVQSQTARFEAQSVQDSSRHHRTRAVQRPRGKMKKTKIKLWKVLLLLYEYNNYTVKMKKELWET